MGGRVNPDQTAKFIPRDQALDEPTFDAGFEAGHVWTLLRLAERYYDAYEGFGVVIIGNASHAESMLLVAEDLDYTLAIREDGSGLMEMIFTRA
jgi:hypothetical protein